MQVTAENSAVTAGAVVSNSIVVLAICIVNYQLGVTLKEINLNSNSKIVLVFSVE